MYKPLSERVPDWQYQERLGYILRNGTLAKNTPQGAGALTCFGELAPMVFQIQNGVPLITERNMSFWKKPIAEMLAFINGARTVDEIEHFGCDFWKDYRGKGTELGLEPNDLGPGSYGAVFHDFETVGRGPLNQFAQVIDQIRNFPAMRTHLVTAWRPDYTARGPNRKVQVAPCHGIAIHFRVLEDRLNLVMVQRSGDLPVGVPSNMIQYAALLLMVCQVTGYQPGHYSHIITDAHIYENQFDSIRELIKRDPRPFPILKLDPGITNLFDFRIEHFSLEEYEPHPAIKIPYLP